MLTTTAIQFVLSILTPWDRVLLEKLTDSQLLKKSHKLYGIRSYITAFTNVRHLSLSWARSIQSMPSHPSSWKSISILSSYLRTPTKSKLYLANSLVTVMTLLWTGFLYSKVPTFMSLFHRLDRTKGSTQVRGTFICFVTKPVFTVRSCQHLAQPLWRVTPCRLSATAYSIYSELPPYWWPFLHPQPEDAPCRGDSSLYLYIP